MKNLFNACNIYTFLWLIINVKGVLYDSDLFSVIVYLIVTAMAVYYATLCLLRKNNPKVVRIYNVLFVVLVLYGILNFFIGGDTKLATHAIPKDFYLQNVVKSMLPFYAYYEFARKGLITRKWICTFSIAFLAATIGFYFYKQEQIILEAVVSDDGVTNNVGYIFVALLPLFCFWENKRIVQYLLLAICMVFIVLSMKRGAILIGAICILFFVYTTLKQVSHASFKRMIVFLSLTGVLFFLGYHFIMGLLDTNDFFISRVNETLEGDSSSRDVLYTHYLNLYWNDSNIIEYLIGRGADGTLRSGYNYAHNDWLEILINQGLLGIILFFIFWLRLYQLWAQTQESILKNAFGMCCLILFLKTLFSMSINDMPIYSTLILGIGVAAYQNRDVHLQLNS